LPPRTHGILLRMSDATPEERRWREAIESGAFGVWDLDPRREVVHYSPAWKLRLGFPRVQAPDSTGFWRCRVHPEDFEAMLGALRSHIEGGRPDYEMRFRLRSNGSGYRTMLSRGRVVARNELGHATRMVGTMVDLTDRPASTSTHGLAAEDPRPPAEAVPTPFHALLGVRDPAAFAADRMAVSHEPHRLIDRVDDLLERAVREGLALQRR
jgi:PAS domain S-box-containing protein